MKAILLATALLCASVPHARAAPLTYTLVDKVYNTFPNDPGVTNPGVSFTIVLSDAAVARGSFNLFLRGGALISEAVGDLADFVTIGPVSASRRDRFQGLDASISFAPDGAITSSRISLISDPGYDGEFSGTSASFNGSYRGDGYRCGSRAVPCLVTGRLELTSVPEPASLAVLGLGLLGLGALRRAGRG